MDLNAFCSTGVTASVATGTRALAPSSTCPCDIWSMAPAATGGTANLSDDVEELRKIAIHWGSLYLAAMAAASFASSSGVSVLVPFAMDANARCRTGVMASVATGTSFLAPPSTSPCDTWSIAPTETPWNVTQLGNYVHQLGEIAIQQCCCHLAECCLRASHPPQA